jgi:hypothetical protein
LTVEKVMSYDALRDSPVALASTHPSTCSIFFGLASSISVLPVRLRYLPISFAQVVFCIPSKLFFFSLSCCYYYMDPSTFKATLDSSQSKQTQTNFNLTFPFVLHSRPFLFILPLQAFPSRFKNYANSFRSIPIPFYPSSLCCRPFHFRFVR